MYQLSTSYYSDQSEEVSEKHNMNQSKIRLLFC